MKRSRLLVLTSLPLLAFLGCLVLMARLGEQPTAQRPHPKLVSALEFLQQSGLPGPQAIQSGTEAQYGDITVTVIGDRVHFTGSPETLRRANEAIRRANRD